MRFKKSLKWILCATLSQTSLLSPNTTFAASSCEPLASPDYIQCVMNGVFIVGTWGRDGRGGGIENIIDGKIAEGTNELRDRLTKELKVPGSNLYRQAWNDVDDRSPTRSPSTGVHLQNLREHLAAQNLDKPSYLALIGHSFGGWASLRFSRLAELPKTPDLIFVMDPVVGATNNATSEDTRGVADLIVNYFQDKFVTAPACTPEIGFESCVAGISCGQMVINSNGKPFYNFKSDYQQWSDGSYLTDACAPAPLPALNLKRAQTHTHIDDDHFVQAQLTKLVLKGVRDLKARSQRSLVEAIIRSMNDRVTTERLAFFTESMLNSVKSQDILNLYRNFRLLQIFKQVLNRLPVGDETKWTMDFISKGGNSRDIATVLYLSMDLIGAPGRTISLENIYYQYLKQNRDIDKVAEILLGIDNTVYTYTWNDQEKTCLRSPRTAIVANVKCGKAERQIQIFATSCDVSYNGDYRFTLQAGQDDCPVLPPPPSGPIASGIYKLKNRYSDKCIDVRDASNKEGAKIQQMPCSGKKNQAFSLQNISADIYTLTAWHSQQCLNPEPVSSNSDMNSPQTIDPMTDMSNGMNTEGDITQKACNFMRQQNLRIIPTNDGTYQLQFAENAACVGFRGLSRENGVELVQTECSGQANQDWIIEQTDPFANPISTIATDVAFEIIGNYSEKCLEVKNEMEGNGFSLQQWMCSGAANQRFQFQDLGNGWYQLREASSGKCVEAQISSINNGTPMVLGSCDGSDKQSIQLEPAENMSYKFRFKHSLKCMDVQDTSKENGKAVHQWDCGNAPDQNWLLNELNTAEVYVPQNEKNKEMPLCMYMHKENTMGGTKGTTSFVDAFGKAKNCNISGDWKTSCKDGNGMTDEVACMLPSDMKANEPMFCQYKHKKNTNGGKAGETNFLDAFGKSKSCTIDGDWKSICKEGNGDTDEVGCAVKTNTAPNAPTMCQYKHKKDTAGGKAGQVTKLDAFGQTKSCDANSNWKESCKDKNGDTEEAGCW